MEKYIEPTFHSSAYNCPHCGAYSHHYWAEMLFSHSIMSYYYISKCSHCERYSLWHEELMVYPNTGYTVEPNSELPVDIQLDYKEAAQICNQSPRGAAALLKLCVQKIVEVLGENKGDLDAAIGSLVSKGLPKTVQEALDTVRVIGNNAVHPGSIDLKDDIHTVKQLFWLVNFIAEKLISEPKQISEVFDLKVPENNKKSIKTRDNGK